MLTKHKCILFGIEHYTALGIARSLGREGIHPDLIAVKGKAKVVSSSKYISRVFFVDTVEEGYEILLREYGDRSKRGDRPFIFCSDDKTIGYLDLHYEELKDKFIFYNAGQQGRINAYMDKFNILDCAKANGLKTLEARMCKLGEVPDDLVFPIITKSISPNVGGWKADVNICYSAKELVEAYKHIQADTVLIQKYIDKKNEYCLEGFSADHGKQVFLSIASTYNYLITGYYSPYMTIRNMNNDLVRRSLEGMFSDIGYEGVFEVEFLIDQDDELYFSEINFRGATWGWGSTMAGMNLPVLWGESMLSGKIGNCRKEVPEGVMGMVEPIDYGKRVDTGKITPAQWLADFKDAAVTYYYDKDDPGPYYVMMENWERLK